MEAEKVSMRKEHYKLVRDHIPEIIESDGRTAHVRILDDNEMIKCLENKLQEEVNEYVEDRSVEELADILEVIYALCKMKGVSKEELERTRAIKEIARGAFNEKIFLEYVED